MRRYDDRYGQTRLYVGRLSSRTRSRDLDHLFSRYGRVRDVDMKNDYAFVDFSDPRDADDARYSLNGRQFDGSRLIVEFAKGAPRGPGGSREYVGRGGPPPPGSGRCFNCGLDGHWARDCKAGDWKNKCYRCGERGHVERNCHNSPKKLSRGRSNSRSPVRSRSPRRGRGRSRSFSRSRSYSRSRSPVKREKKGSRIPSSSRSPEPRNYSPPSKARKRSPTPERDGSEYSESPRAKSPSPVRSEMDSPAASLSEKARGHGPVVSPSPREDISPVVDDDDNDNPGSPRGSQSP